jgi:hypothetical protein
VATSFGARSTSISINTSEPRGLINREREASTLLPSVHIAGHEQHTVERLSGPSQRRSCRRSTAAGSLFMDPQLDPAQRAFSLNYRGDCTISLIAQ